MTERFTIKFDGRYKVSPNDQLCKKSFELIKRIEIGVMYIKCHLTMKENEFYVGKSLSLYNISKKNFSYDSIKKIHNFDQYKNCAIVLHSYKDELWFSYFKFSDRTKMDKFQNKIAHSKNENINDLIIVVDRKNILIDIDEYETVESFNNFYQESKKKELCISDTTKNLENRKSNDTNEIYLEMLVDKSDNNNSSINNYETLNLTDRKNEDFTDNNKKPEIQLENLNDLDSSMENINIYDNFDSLNHHNILTSLGTESDYVIINGSVILSCQTFSIIPLWEIMGSCECFDY